VDLAVRAFFFAGGFLLMFFGIAFVDFGITHRDGASTALGITLYAAGILALFIAVAGG